MARKTARKATKKRKKMPAKRKKKASADTWFGLVIDGKRTPFSLPSVEDAMTMADGLRGQGYEIAIYNQDTNRIVRRR